MRTLFEIMSLILVLTVTLSAHVECLTGDLVQAHAVALEWPPAALTRPTMQVFYDTSNFRIHFDISGNNAVFESDVDIDPTDGVPDYINRLAEYMESSRHMYVDILGFDPPPPDNGLGGNDLYDVYVTDIPGMVVPEFPSNYYPGRPAYVSYAFIGKDLRNQYHPDDPYPFLMATCSHEFFHSVQMAYRAFSQDETFWWYELSAVMAEEFVFDDLNELYYYLPDYYLKVDKSIYLTGGSHMYGAWVFAQHMVQNHGPEFLRGIFEKLITLDRSLIAIGAAYAERNLNFATEFADYICWNYFTANNWRPGFFEEGAYFPITVPLTRVHDVYPTGIIENPKSIENLGACYIVFNSPHLPKSRLLIDFYGDETYPLLVAIAAIPETGIVNFGIHYVFPGDTLSISVPRFFDLESVLMAITWLFQGYSIRDSADFDYQAILDTNLSSIETAESELPAALKLGANYPNPFNSSTYINFEWNSSPECYRMELMDIMGRLVGSIEGIASSGENKVLWRMNENDACGIYFYRLSIGRHNMLGRMLYLK